MKALRQTMIAASLVGLAGCQSYEPYPDRRVVNNHGVPIEDTRLCQRCGYVEDVRPVSIKDESIGAGAVIGAIVGAAAGRQIGDGSGQDVAAAAGAVGGAMAGHKIHKRGREGQPAYEFTIELDSGREVRVVQTLRYGLDRGDRVRVLEDRVTPV